MKSGVVPLVGWGVALAAVAALGLFVFGLGALPTALLAGAGALAVAAGLAALRAEGRRPRADAVGRPELLLEASVATTALATGVVVALVGAAAAGSAVLGLGLGLMLLGAGGIVRERRAGRRLLRDASGDTG